MYNFANIYTVIRYVLYFHDPEYFLTSSLHRCFNNANLSVIEIPQYFHLFAGHVKFEIYMPTKMLIKEKRK